MYWGAIWRGLSVLFAMVLTLIPSAFAYDAELRDLAAELAKKLELSGQKSGTILDFTDLQGSPNELGRFLAQELSNQLVADSKKMTFLDRTNLQTLLKENNLSASGLIDPSTSKKLGNLIGIDTVIVGTVIPFGDKIRLSVRAVAVETGKIVVSQAATLPASRDLVELATRGVSSSVGSGATPQTSPPDPRDRFRGDSVRVSAREVTLTRLQFVNDPVVSATVLVENLSGIGFDAVLAGGSVTIGGCEVLQTAGIPMASMVYVTHGVWREWQYIPTGGRLNVTLKTNPCAEIGPGEADIAGSLVVKTGDKMLSLPLSVSQVPVKVLSTPQ